MKREMKSKELFFTCRLTEDEHCIVKGQIREECERLGLILVYYRKFKTGHVPLYREVKVVGTGLQVNKFKKWMKSINLNDYSGNYHKDLKNKK